MKLLRYSLAVSLALVTTDLVADEAADRKTSLAQIRELAALNHAHAMNNGGTFAKSLEEVFAANKKANRALLVAPGAKDKNAPSYELVTPGEKLSQVADPSRTVAIRGLYKLSGGGVPVAFVDGHVEILGEAAAR